MFDITSTKLLLLGIVALVVIGPKDLPVLLRTLGKYMGMIKRQAAEFRAQFEEAMRESELEQLKKDVEQMGTEAQASMREAELSVTSELDSAKAEIEKATDTALLDKPADFETHTPEGAPISRSDPEHAGLNGADPPEPDGEVKSDPEPARVEHKSGV
jgi:sec-independent protein translocase protein TatB